MIRMTMILSAAVFLTLAIGGEQGQVRAGLASAQARPAVPAYRYIPVPQDTVQQVALQTESRISLLPTAVVTATALNLRSGPSAGSAALDRLGHGEEVSVVETRGDWTRIRLEGSGGEGWVSSDYIAAMPVRMAGN